MRGTFPHLRVCPVCGNDIPWHAWDDAASYRRRHTCSHSCGIKSRDKIIRTEQWEAQDARLRELVEEGITAREIGALLGCSRNAVIGRCRRIGVKLKRLSSRDVTRQRPRRTELRRLRKTKKAPRARSVPITDQDIPHAQRKTLLELGPCDCHWPVGDPATPDFFFCGGVRQGGSSYCTAHEHRSRDYTPEGSRHGIPRPVSVPHTTQRRRLAAMLAWKKRDSRRRGI